MSQNIFESIIPEIITYLQVTARPIFRWEVIGLLLC